jgi:anti-anti-sigma factor
MDKLTLDTKALAPKQAYLITATGTVDSETTPMLEENLKHAIECGQYNIVLDLSGVDFISSSGFGLILGMVGELRANKGDLTLLAVPDPLLEMLTIMGVEDYFRIVSSVDELSAVKDPI